MNTKEIYSLLEKEDLIRKNIIRLLECDELSFLIKKGELKSEIEIEMDFKDCPCN